MSAIKSADRWVERACLKNRVCTAPHPLRLCGPLGSAEPRGRRAEPESLRSRRRSDAESGATPLVSARLGPMVRRDAISEASGAETDSSRLGSDSSQSLGDLWRDYTWAEVQIRGASVCVPCVWMCLIYATVDTSCVVWNMDDCVRSTVFKHEVSCAMFVYVFVTLSHLGKRLISAHFFTCLKLLMELLHLVMHIECKKRQGHAFR